MEINRSIEKLSAKSLKIVFVQYIVPGPWNSLLLEINMSKKNPKWGQNKKLGVNTDNGIPLLLLDGQ